MAFDPLSAAAAGVGAVVGGIGANNAAKRQLAAANQAKRMARSNMLMGIQVNEPARAIGYQGYGDIARQFGYSMPEYTSANSLMATMNPLTTKDVKGMVKNGMTAEQIGGIGTLAGLNPKGIKRLQRAGLSMDQIQQLATRQAPAGSAPQGGQPVGNAFIDSPDYQFRRDEGQRGIANSFAARGGAASGNALRALSEFNSGLAGSEFSNWFNRRMQLSGRGDQANQNIQTGGTNYNRDYSQAVGAAGDARASGVLGVTGAIQGGVSGMFGSFGQKPPASTGPTFGGYGVPSTGDIWSQGIPDWRKGIPGWGG